jgi:histidinol-phosphate aminotransferase
MPRRRDPAIDLFLDANEGRPLASAQAAISAALLAGDAARYPSFADLEAAIADRWAVDPARVVVTAGGDEGIARVTAARVTPGAKVLVYEPAFEMFGVYARGRGATLLGLEWLDDRPFPLDRSLAVLADDPAVGLVCLASPSNPLGQTVTHAELMALADGCAAAGAAFLYDGAYTEYAAEDPSALLLERCDSYVVRTFSKAYGLAGLRMGYVICPDATEAGLLRSLGSPYPTSSLAAAGALAGLADVDGLTTAVSRARAERARLAEVLAARGMAVRPSQANFVFFRMPGSAGSAGRFLPDGATAASKKAGPMSPGIAGQQAGVRADGLLDPQALAKAMAARGIAIRTFLNRPELHDAVRISCPGDALAFQRLMDALDDILPGGDT